MLFEPGLQGCYAVVELTQRMAHGVRIGLHGRGDIAPSPALPFQRVLKRALRFLSKRHVLPPARQPAQCPLKGARPAPFRWEKH